MRQAHDHRRPAGNGHSGLWPLCFRFCVSAVGPAVATGGTIAAMWRAVDRKLVIGMLGCALTLVAGAAVGAEGGGDAAGKPPATQGPESMAFLYGKPTLGAAGAPRSLAYNSPFVPGFAKYSEVQFPVVRVTDERDGLDRKPE